MFNNLSWQEGEFAFSVLFSKNSICMKEVEVCTPTVSLRAECFQNSPCILFSVIWLIILIKTWTEMLWGMEFAILLSTSLICFSFWSSVTQSVKYLTAGPRVAAVRLGFCLDTELTAGVKNLVYLSSFCFCGEFVETRRMPCLVSGRCKSRITVAILGENP